MSLDLSNKSGRAHNVAAFAGTDLSGVTAATFDSGDVANAGSFLLQVDTSGGDIDAGTLPTSMALGGTELLVDGVELTIVKTTTDGNTVTFADPVTGITYAYVNRQGESMSLVFDTSTGAGRWVAKV